jgi:type IV secretion system protein VirD4
LAPTSESRRKRKKAKPHILLGRTLTADQKVGFCTRPPTNHRHDLISQSSEGSLITVGKTGTGKGRASLIPNLLKYSGSAVVLDVKGELYFTTAQARRAMNQTVFLLDPFHFISSEPDRLNFFDLLGVANNKELDAEAQSLAHIFGGQNLSAKEPFWDIHGTGLLGGCMSAVATIRPENERNFRSLLEMFMCDDIVYQLAVLLDKSEKSMTPMARHEIGSFLSITDNTRSGILATTISYLKTFTSEQIINSLCNSTLPLSDLISGRKPFTIYIVIPPAYIKSHFTLVKAWVHTIMKALMMRTEIPESPTIFFLDEIGQGHLPILESIITIGRGYGIKVWLFLQNLFQLKSAYEGWATMLGNCDVWQIFSASDFLTAKELSEVTGIHPVELVSLGADEQYLLINGRRLRAAKLDYLNDPLFAGLYEENPYYARLNRASRRRH